MSVVFRERRMRLARTLGGVVLGLVGVCVFSIWLFINLTHLRDRYQLDNAFGEWAGLAFNARQGVLYPPLYRDGYYGGTRYSPVPILMHAAAYAASDDIIASGKLVGLVGSTAMMACMLVLLRRSGVALGLALIASSLVLITPIGWEYGVIKYDAMGVAAQLAALIAIGWRGERRGVLGPMLGGAACAFAVFTKISAVWAPAAGFAYLAIYRRRDLPAFIAGGVLASLALFGFFYLYTDGRILDNFRVTIFAGRPASSFASPGGLLHSAKDMSFNLREEATAVWAITPLCIVAVVQGIMGRRPTLAQLALVACIPLTLAIFTNPGIVGNHLIDMIVLIILCAAEYVAGFGVGSSDEGGTAAAGESAKYPGAVFLLTFLWVTLTSLQTSGIIDELRKAMPASRRAEAKLSPELAPDSWKEVFRPGDVVLSADATIPILMGQRPIILHSFPLKRVVDINPEALADMIGRIDRREFDWIASYGDLDDTQTERPGQRTRDNHWGPEVVEAILRNYERRSVLWGYTVYGRKKS